MFTPELKSGAAKVVLADWSLPPAEPRAVFPTGGKPPPNASNYGSGTDLRVFKGNGRVGRIFLKFSVATLPPGTMASDVAHARLRLFAARSPRCLDQEHRPDDCEERRRVHAVHNCRPPLRQHQPREQWPCDHRDLKRDQAETDRVWKIARRHKPRH